MTPRVRLVSALLLTSFVMVAHAQSWDYEKQRTLSEMISLRREILGKRHPAFIGSEAGEFALNNSAVTSRVKLRYMGEKRLISIARLRLLEGMSQAYSLNPESTKRLVVEMLFKEGDKEYWIPVKKEVISTLESLKTGEEVMVYIDLVGTYRTKGEWDWVFTVNAIS
jgi:hypothetical protein